MLKSVIVSALLSTSVIATHFNGAYVGIGVGNTNLDSFLYSKFPHLREKTINLGANKLSSQVFAGYGGRIGGGHLYGGVEGFFRYENIKATFLRHINPPDSIFRTSMYFRNTTGISLIGGTIVDKFLIYIKGGIVSSNSELKYVSQNNDVYQSNKNKNGKLYGGGVKYSICQNVNMGIEFNHINYQASSILIPRQNGSFYWKAFPSLNSYHVNLSYVF